MLQPGPCAVHVESEAAIVVMGWPLMIEAPPYKPCASDYLWCPPGYDPNRHIIKGPTESWHAWIRRYQHRFLSM